MSQRADQLVEAGLWLKLSGDTDGAQRLFEQAVRLDPTHTRARQLLEGRTPPAPGSPKNPGPPGTAAPPSNAPAPPPTIVEQDWAMATGILEERRRGNTPPPVPLARGASVPETPTTLIWGQVTEPQSPAPATDTPWEPLSSPLPPPVPDAQQGAPTSGTLIWGTVPPRIGPPAQESAWDRTSRPPVTLGPAPEMGRALDLVSTPVPTFTPPPGSLNKRGVDEEVRTLLEGAKDLLELDDHTGAIDLILKAQELAPTHPEVARLRERSEQILQTMFESKLGSMELRPRVVLKDDEIIWLNLDHRAGFVLAQIDGTVSFEDVFAVSGMSRLDTARILAQLMDEGVIKA